MRIADYDYVSLYTPEGKVKPLESINQSTSLGTAAVALRSNKVGVIIAHTPCPEYAYKQEKIFKINNTTLFTFSGITNDGFFIEKYLLEKSLSERINKVSEIRVPRVLKELGVMASLRTMYSTTRPFGVAGLVLNYNKETNKMCLVEFTPSGGIHECYAMSIGARAQSAKTILERDYTKEQSLDELIQTGIRSLSNAVSEPKGTDVTAYGIDSEKGVFEIDVAPYFNN